ncbi:MAG: DUF5309 family protein [Chthoniobacteraceae bacterium]
MPQTNAINQVGKIKDIADFIAVADMKNTPLSTMISKQRKAKLMLFSNQADAYDDPDTEGAVDGQDVKEFEDAAKNRGEIFGRLMIFEKTAKVTTAAEAQAQAGGVAAISSEMARAKAKKAIEFKRKQEKVYLGDQDSRSDNGVKGGLTRGMGAWISSTPQGDIPVPEQFRTPAGCIFDDVIANFTEEKLRNLLQARYEEVGMPSGVLTGITGTQIKNKVTDFSKFSDNKDGKSNVRFYQTTNLAKYSAMVDIYEGDYGTVEWHLDNYMPDQYRCEIIDLDFWAQYTLKNPAWKDLPDLGGGPRALLQGILGIMCDNPLGQIKIKARAA